MAASPCSVVVLISGNGSNLQALIDASDSGQYAIKGVISNKADAYGLQRAANANIPADVIDHKLFADRESFDAALAEKIDSYEPDLVVLAGFMRILSAGFVQHYSGRILNIHPSLLPNYRGTNTHQRVLDAGEKQHGVSVHFVTEELDGGPVVLQAVVDIQDGDNADELAKRVAQQEHIIYPKAVTWFAAKRLSTKGNIAFLDGNKLDASGVREFA
ncbi:MAG: phosphoribosylglycinamide formyltransferase [Pseudohongiellaceae bacterium]|nr:phosphoribosylglycinamide formyltransferase [Pseudohongiellaceae bacterium]